MRKFYIKPQMIHTYEICYMFRAINRHPQGEINKKECNISTSSVVHCTHADSETRYRDLCFGSKTSTLDVCIKQGQCKRWQIK